MRPLVTLAVVLDGSGFSRKSRIFAGNIGEAETLQEMIEALADTDPVAKGSQSEIPWEQRPTVVMDAGITTQENIEGGALRVCPQYFGFLCPIFCKNPIKGTIEHRAA